MSFNTCQALADCVAVVPRNTPPGFSAPSGNTPPTSEPKSKRTYAAAKRSDIIHLFQGCADELRTVQSRLGTPAERPDDRHLARELAHKAKNLRFAVEVWGQITARLQGPRSAA
jgi:hypothetical protein